MSSMSQNTGSQKAADFNVGLGTLMREELQALFQGQELRMLNTNRGTVAYNSVINTVCNREGHDWVVQQSDTLYKSGQNSEPVVYEGDSRPTASLTTEIKFREIDGKWLARVRIGTETIKNPTEALKTIRNVLELSKPEPVGV